MKEIDLRFVELCKELQTYGKELNIQIKNDKPIFDKRVVKQLGSVFHTRSMGTDKDRIEFLNEDLTIREIYVYNFEGY